MVVTITIEDVVANTTRLPTSPQVMPKMQAILRDPNASISEIAELIKQDAGLTAQVIRMANSAFYGASEKVKDPESAVNRIGFNEVFKLVGMIVSRHVLAGKLPLYDLGAGQLWRISVCTAHMMHYLSELVGIEAESAYTCGLVHSIGKTAVNHYYTEKNLEQSMSGFRAITPEEEWETLGFTNADVAAALLTGWEFEEAITIPVGCQYNPDLATDEHRLLSVMLYLAIDTAYLIDAEPESFEEKYDPFHEYLIELAVTREIFIDAAKYGNEAINKFSG